MRASSDGKAKMKGERLSNANERVENQRSRLPMNELCCFVVVWSRVIHIRR